MNNCNKIGLYVGKFIAYHKGHQHFIKQFASECDKLNLILCGNSKLDRVPLNVRKTWLENDLKFGYLSGINNKIKLHTLIEDNITPYPEGIYEWCNIVQNLIGEKIDIMLGNDDYVSECAKIFESDYMTPDKERNKFQVSSTKILDNGLKYYDLLTEVSKPYFNKTVLVTGAESTGKTTLAKALAQYYKGEYVEEFGRAYEEGTIKEFNRNCTEWTVEDYEQVAQTQDEMIKRALQKPIKLLFVDTDALITQMYCELYIKKHSESFDRLIKKQNFDLILFLTPNGTEWVHDGIRNLQQERNIINELIFSKLHLYNKKFMEIDNLGGYQSRFEKVKKIINEKFNI